MPPLALTYRTSKRSGVERLMGPLVIELLAETLKRRCCAARLPAAGRVVSAFSVRCIRSCRRRGPKTPAGKAKVSNNAITHAISSTRLIVPGEDSADWETYRQRIVDALAPVGAA